MTKGSIKAYRQMLIKKYGHLYERHFSSRPGCFYCGDIASTIDHCPPISFCDTKDKKWFQEKNIKFYTVICCKECNLKLSNKTFLFLRDRVEYIIQVLEKKSDQVVLWTEEEIKEMSAVFERSIRARRKQSDLLYERVRFAQELLHRSEDIPEDLP